MTDDERLQQDDDCRAKIKPMADGRWQIDLRRVNGMGSNPDKVWMGSERVEREYGVDAQRFARTEKRARRKASRMLRRLRTALRNLGRETVVVDR